MKIPNIINQTRSALHGLALAAAVSVLALAATSTTYAATITWGSATDDALNADSSAFLDTDVQINGAFVAAVTNGGVRDHGGCFNSVQIVNGVAFQSCSAYSYPTFTYGSSPISLAWTSGRTDYGDPGNAYGNFGYDSKLLLTGGGDGQGGGDITLSSLVPDQLYQVQVWASTWNNTFSMTVGGVYLQIGNPPGTVSQYVVGTFTADGTSQTIPWSGIAPTAVSLRLLTAAPNPATAGNSTVVASPASPVGNDGVCWSTITVTLKDASGNPVWGKTVTLAQTAGSGATISAASGPSGLNGVVTFSVTSTTLGDATFTATDTTDSVAITETPTVTFAAPAIITSIAAGDWNTAGTWDLSIPTSGDDVVINGKAITVNTTPAGAALLTLSGATSIYVAAGQSLATDTVAFSNGNNVAITGAGKVVIGPAKNLQVTSTSAQWTDINAQIVDNPSGASAVTIATGGGEVNWKGFNMYSGGTTINGGGQLNADNYSCFGSGPVVLNDVARLAYLRGQTNALTVNNGSLLGGSWDGPITLPLACSAYANDGVNLNGKITGPGGITINNSAELTNATSDYTGKTVVNSGTLYFNQRVFNAGEPGPLGAPTGASAVIDLWAGSGLQYNGGQSNTDRYTPYVVTNRPINLAGDNAGTVYLNGANVNDTWFQFNGEFLATGTATRTLQITAKGDSPTYVYNGAIPDMSDASLVSVHAVYDTDSSRCDGHIWLNGANRFTGSLTLTGGGSYGPGVVYVGGTGSLGYNGAGSNYAGDITFVTTNSVAKNTTLNYASSTAQTLSGAISGDGNLTVSGAGILTLSGTDTHSGDTTVDAGCKLKLTQKAALGTATSVYLSPTSELDLAFAAPDMTQVAKLFVDGTEKPVGLYKAVGGAGDGIELSQITGTGRLLVGIPLVADFAATPSASGDAPLPVTFTDNSASILGTLNSWSWDFGDGTTYDTTSYDLRNPPLHTYALWGTYPVTLTVGDTKGYSSSTTKTITVTQPLHVVVSSAAQYETVTVNVGPTGSVTFNTGVVNPGFGGLTGKGTFELKDGANAAVTLKVGSDTILKTTFDGVLAGTGGLTKVGSDVFKLTGANIYGGVTTISNGTLMLAYVPPIPSEPAVVYTFDTDGSTGPVSNSGSLGSAKNATINDTSYGSITSGGHHGQGLTMTAAEGHLLPIGKIDLSSGPTTGWTASIWYRNLTDGGDWHTLYHCDDDAYPTIINQDSRHLYSLWGDPSDTGYSMPAGDTGWHMITTVGKVDGTTQFYIDGVAVGTPAANRASSNLVSIGARDDSAQQFAGQLDDFYFYQRELGASDVLQLYNGTSDGGGGGGGYDILPATTSVYIVTGAKLDLGGGVNNTVNKLYLGGIGKLHGTYGSTDSTAENKDNTYFSGTGMLTVTSDASGGNYTSWAAAQTPPLTGGPNAVGKDGIPNLVVYALDLKTDGTNGSPGTLAGRVLSFAKRSDAVNNGDVSYAIETSPNLKNPWTTRTPDVNSGSTISYTLPTGQGKIFARLIVTEN